MTVWLGLGLSFASALIVSWAYTREHAAATSMPPVSVHQPLRSVRLLAGAHEWLVGFSAESGGWLVYLMALKLAPLALVQAINATGVAVLALIMTGGRPSRLSSRERWAVASSVCGLVLLALSLIGSTPTEGRPGPESAGIWLGALLLATGLLVVSSPRIVHASVLGAAAGLLFAGGDTSAKMLVLGGSWLVVAVPLVIFYSLGSIQLQTAFQHGNVLMAAGTANLVTNAVPIVAGILLFRQSLPHGPQLLAQIAAFGAILVGAMLLGDRAHGATDAAVPPGDALGPAVTT
jgi:hypothetical protein